jgi:nicotinamide-nucleotide amidase
MVVELLNTGSELMLGRVLNTHQQWLCRRLADLGYVVSRQIAVPDRGGEIEWALKQALARANLVLVTGGLGPTSDDLTRDLVAGLLGRPLREDASVLAHIDGFFAQRNRRMPGRTRVQALVPEGAIVLPNPHGTAPGLALELRPNPYRAEGDSSWLILLPGPPRELQPMFYDSVVPLLRRVMPLPRTFVCRTLRCIGIGESVVEEKVAPSLESLIQAGLELGYCARPGQVDVRLAAGNSGADELVSAGEAIVRARLGHWIYGTDEDELETVVIRLLTERKETLALAESCTGGCVSNRLTDVPGASLVFIAGFVTYSNAAKQEFLGVQSSTLQQHGAVSEAVAREMAEGARSRNKANYALALTGIAGPTGGSPAKPVGTVYIALAGEFETRVEQHLNPWDRETFKQVSANQALDLLRRTMLQVVPPAK